MPAGRSALAGQVPAAAGPVAAAVAREGLVLNPGPAALGVEQGVVLEAAVARQLRPHQREGILFMYSAIARDQGCILADTMGLGKTLQALGLLWAVVNGSPMPGGPPLVRKAVVVCPSSLCGNWRAEVRKWLGDRRLKPVTILAAGRERVEAQLRSFRDYSTHKMLILSYEQLRRHVDLVDDACDLLICDEGHRLRTQGTATARQLDGLRCRRRILLSGTPLQNDMDELFHCGRFVRPDLFPDATRFQRLVAQPLTRSREPGASAEDRVAGARAAGELEERTSQFILRRMAEVLQNSLPPRLEIVLRLRMAVPQVRAYRAILAELQLAPAHREMARALQAMMALRLLCNDAGDVLRSARRALSRGEEDACPASLASRGRGAESSSESEGEAPATLGAGARGGGGFWEACAAGAEEAARLGASAKIAVLLSLLRHFRRTAPGDRVVVVSNFRRTLLRLQGMLRSINIRTSLLCGSTPPAQRMDLVDAFNAPGSSGMHVLLLSSKAGGVGLNLVGANRLVLFDPDWNPANDAQAMARIWREGQKKEVFIYRLVLGGTLEEKICQRQHMKEDLAAVTVDGVDIAGNFAGGPPRLSWEELRRVFELEGYDAAGLPMEDALASSAFGSPVAADSPQVRGALLDCQELQGALLSVHVVDCRNFSREPHVREGELDSMNGQAQALPLPPGPWLASASALAAGLRLERAAAGSLGDTINQPPGLRQHHVGGAGAGEDARLAGHRSQLTSSNTAGQGVAANFFPVMGASSQAPMTMPGDHDHAHGLQQAAIGFPVRMQVGQPAQSAQHADSMAVGEHGYNTVTNCALAAAVVEAAPSGHAHWKSCKPARIGKQLDASTQSALRGRCVGQEEPKVTDAPGPAHCQAALRLLPQGTSQAPDRSLVRAQPSPMQSLVLSRKRLQEGSTPAQRHVGNAADGKAEDVDPESGHTRKRPRRTSQARDRAPAPPAAGSGAAPNGFVWARYCQ